MGSLEIIYIKFYRGENEHNKIGGGGGDSLTVSAGRLLLQFLLCTIPGLLSFSEEAEKVRVVQLFSKHGEIIYRFFIDGLDRSRGYKMVVGRRVVGLFTGGVGYGTKGKERVERKGKEEERNEHTKQKK